MSKTCWILGKVVYMYYSRLHIQKGGGYKEIIFLLRVQISKVKKLNN